MQIHIYGKTVYRFISRSKYLYKLRRGRGAKKKKRKKRLKSQIIIEEKLGSSKK